MTSRYDKREEADFEKVKALRECSKKALAGLGVKDVRYHDFPDNRFDSVPLLDIVKVVEKTKKELQPELIYTNHAGDLNVDHRQTCQAVLTATRPLAGESVKRILSFEVASSTEWNFAERNHAFLPNVFIDISAYVEAKVKAMNAYSSEVLPYPHPRSPEALRTLASWRGVQCGKKAAEAFQLIREIS